VSTCTSQEKSTAVPAPLDDAERIERIMSEEWARFERREVGLNAVFGNALRRVEDVYFLSLWNALRRIEDAYFLSLCEPEKPV
jgi:hypothetical protein